MKTSPLFLILLTLLLAFSGCGGGTLGTGLGGYNRAGGTVGTGLGQSYSQGGSGSSVGAILFWGKIMWANGQPVAGAQLQFESSEGSFSASTDNNGSFNMSLPTAPQGTTRLLIKTDNLDTGTSFEFFRYFRRNKPMYFYINNNGQVRVRPQS